MESGLEIAVIGMAGRFPGAGNIHEFWENIKNGVESITFFSDEELLETGVDPQVLENPHYVEAVGILADIEYFDAAFFGYIPKEAEIMDPQIRIFHECTWTALEDAGYDPLSYKGLIGLYAGASPNLGWLKRALLSGKSAEIGSFAASQLIQKDYLTMRVSYKLNLNGPSLLLYTACSTSLVAIHMGYQALLNGECDISLAGGVTVVRLAKAGYMYKEGMISSPDGHCRAFDASAKGFVGADGVGVVVLRCLRDAVSAGDHIYAVIKGSSINNDGMQKAGFTAPSVKGQAEAIKMAMQMAEVEPESIGYVETHGTGTALGDPVEIEGLKRAFNTGKKGFCGLGSVKTNLGHVDAAAGAAGFIKTVLAINHRLIPPSLYFEIPNPAIDFIDSPFYVNSALIPWENHGHPLRAGVSSFGQGGTNAHVILEEWSSRQDPGTRGHHTGDPGHLIALSARTPSALDIMTENLARHFKENPHIQPADVAFTLLAGRHADKYRKMFVCTGIEEAIEILDTPGSPAIHSYALQEENRPVVFLFPGEKEGVREQYQNIGEKLYRQKPVYRKETDRCLEILKSRSPARFIFQYTLAKMLMECGIKPYTLMGEGDGETTAQCLSGQVNLEHALKSTAMTSAAGANTTNPTTLSFSRRLKQLAKLKNPVFLYFGSNIEEIEKILDDIGDFSGQLVPLVGTPREQSSYLHFLMNQVGRLWLHGINLDWERFYSGEQRYRTPLPTYPFESRRYWVDDPRLSVSKDTHVGKKPGKRRSILHPRPELRSKYTPPAGQTEMKLAELWQEFFGFEQIGARDDFFELGGDSLKAITVISRIHQELHVNVPVTEFFNKPTIEGIAQYISAKEKEDTYLSIEPVEEKEFYPVSLAQRRLYIFQQMDMDSISYNISLVYILAGEFDQKEMENSFMKLIDRHESLKTSFEIIANEPIQRIHQHVDFKFEYHDLVSAGDDDYSTRDIIKNFVRPFDLSQPPLFRAELIHGPRPRGQENTQHIYLLMVDMHHIISDGTSLQIMFKDFMMLYKGSELSPLPIQNKDFAQWQNRETIKEQIKKQEEFWVKQFEGDIPQLALPTDYDTPDDRDYRGDSIYFEIDENKTAILKELTVTEGATMFMVVLALVDILLWKISGQEDIVIGIGVDIRKDEAQRQIIGMFINTLALRFYLQRDKTFKNFLKDVKKRILLAFENQDYPYELLVEKVVSQRDRERGRNPLFDMFITSQNIGVKGPDKNEPVESQSPGFNLEKYPFQNEAAISIFDIGMRYKDVGDKLGFAFDYSIGLFKKETIKKFIGYFNDIVAAVTGNPDSQLKDIKVSHALLAAETHIIDDVREDFKF